MDNWLFPHQAGTACWSRDYFTRFWTPKHGKLLSFVASPARNLENYELGLSQQSQDWPPWCLINPTPPQPRKTSTPVQDYSLRLRASKTRLIVHVSQSHTAGRDGKSRVQLFHRHPDLGHQHFPLHHYHKFSQQWAIFALIFPLNYQYSVIFYFFLIYYFWDTQDSYFSARTVNSDWRKGVWRTQVSSKSSLHAFFPFFHFFRWWTKGRLNGHSQGARSLARNWLSAFPICICAFPTHTWLFTGTSPLWDAQTGGKLCWDQATTQNCSCPFGPNCGKSK